MNIAMLMPQTMKASGKEMPKSEAFQAEGLSFQSLLEEIGQNAADGAEQSPSRLMEPLEQEALIEELSLLISETLNPVETEVASMFGESDFDAGERETSALEDDLTEPETATNSQVILPFYYPDDPFGQSFQGNDLVGIAYSQIRELVAGMNSEMDKTKLASNLMQLLKTVMELHKQLAEMPPAQKLSLSAGESPESKLLSELLEMMETSVKKETLSDRQLHGTDSKSLAANAVKWLTGQLEPDAIQHKQIPLAVDTEPLFSATSAAPGTMTKLEQFILYSHQTSQVSGELPVVSVDRQLIERLEKIMSTNRLLSLQNGNSQLHIRINPENLGEMMMRFSKIDGEMMVKILVTTAAAKEMLDKNMSQLRHMFSPHQVIVEKQDMAIVQSGSIDSQERESGEQLGEQAGNPSESEGDKSGSEASFETMFEEILLNMKV